MVRSPHGQSIVEFALVMPIMLFTFLGFAEAGILYVHVHDAETAADVIAEVAAQEPGESWNSIVADELRQADCADGTVVVERLSRDRVRATVTCRYVPVVTNGLWPGLRYSGSGEAVAEPIPSPTPSPSP